MGKNFVWGVVFFMAVFGLWLWTKIQTAGKLVYKVLSPEQIKISFTSFRLTWLQPVQVTNPTNTGILLKLIQFDVLLNGSVLGSGFLNQTVIIESLNQTTLKVPCSIGLLDLVQIIPDLLKQLKTRNVTFDLVGNINAEGFTIAVETQANLPIPDLSFLK